MIKLVCPKCQQRLSVPPDRVGRKVACPKCAAPVLVAPPLPAREPSPPATDEFNTLLGMLDADHESTSRQPLAVQVEIQDQRSGMERLRDNILLFFRVIGAGLLGRLRRHAVDLALVLLVAAIGFSIYWFAFRDTWEKENMPRLLQLGANGDAALNATEYADAVREYSAVLDAVRDRRERSAELAAFLAIVEQNMAVARKARDRRVLDKIAERWKEARTHRSTDPPQMIAICNEIIHTARNAGTRDQTLLEVVADVRSIRDDAALQLLRFRIAEADEVPDDRPGVREAAYRQTLVDLRKMPEIGEELKIFQAHVEKIHEEIASRSAIVEAYFASIDRFVVKAIPFLRRLRWGMPEGVFAQRVPEIVEAWRDIDDPPDRTTAGLLLSHSNNITRHIGNLDERRRSRDVLSGSKYIELLMQARPPEIDERAWNDRSVGYINKINARITKPSPTGALLPNVGMTMGMTPEAFEALFEDFRRFEYAFRARHEEVLGRPYAGAVTALYDTLDIKQRAAFYDSLDAFLERAVPTLRRLERGADRQTLHERLVSLDAELSTILDPPDDSDAGDVIPVINQISQTLHTFGFLRQGVGALDVVGQNHPEPKSVNDAVEAMLIELKERRNEPVTNRQARAYQKSKDDWIKHEKERLEALKKAP